MPWPASIKSVRSVDGEVWTEGIDRHACGTESYEDECLWVNRLYTTVKVSYQFRNTKESLSVPVDFFTTYGVPFSYAT